MNMPLDHQWEQADRITLSELTAVSNGLDQAEIATMASGIIEEAMLLLECYQWSHEQASELGQIVDDADAFSREYANGGFRDQRLIAEELVKCRYDLDKYRR